MDVGHDFEYDGTTENREKKNTKIKTLQPQNIYIRTLEGRSDK